MRGAVVLTIALILVVLATQYRGAMAACTKYNSADHCGYILRD